MTTEVSELRVRIQFRAWVWAYLFLVKAAARITGWDPDPRRIAAFMMKGVRVLPA